MRLPNLTKWYPMTGPPRVPDPSLSDAFPQLEILGLETEASLQWLPFFEATARHIYPRQDTRTPSNHGPCPRLITLAASPRVSVNATFISPIMQFNGLVRLSLRSSCYSTGGCTFSLTDDDIEEIAAALPRLNDAGFGRVCPTNSCRTTAFSLVSFSTHCRNLACLEIHVNTTNLRKDLEFASVDPRLDNLPSFPKRALPLLLSLADAPISISQEDVGPVVTGFRRIFPSLDLIGNAVALGELSARLMDEE